MTNTKHTPGPWYIEEQHPKFGGYFIHHNADETQDSDDVVCSDVTNEANARLIVAAPELLEALEMVSSFNWKNNRTHLLEIVNAAIAKAKEA